MNFPLLDRLPIPSRIRARELVQQFREELKNALLRSYEKTSASMDSDKLGSRLLAAWESGFLSEKQFLDNLTVTFVASQENPQLLIISTLYLLAKHPVRFSSPEYKITLS
jgi:cytochrome P450